MFFIRRLPARRLLPWPRRQQFAHAANNGYGDPGCSGPILDDLPVPKGCWFEAHNRRQSSYNKWLLGGFVFMLGSMAFAGSVIDLRLYPQDYIRLSPDDFAHAKE